MKTVIIAAILGAAAANFDSIAAECARPDLMAGIIKRRPYSNDQIFLNGECVTFHHIMPKNRIVTIWNAMVCQYPDLLKDLAQAFSNHGHNFDQNGHKGIKEDFVKVLGLDTGRRPDINLVGTFFKYLQWPPGNLMRGPPPQCRTDDPHENFEYELCWSMGCGSADQNDASLCQWIRSTYGHGLRFVVHGDKEDIVQFAKGYHAIAAVEGHVGAVNSKLWVNASDRGADDSSEDAADEKKPGGRGGKKERKERERRRREKEAEEARRREEAEERARRGDDAAPALESAAGCGNCSRAYTVAKYGRNMFYERDYCEAHPGSVSAQDASSYPPMAAKFGSQETRRFRGSVASASEIPRVNLHRPDYIFTDSELRALEESMKKRSTVTLASGAQVSHEDKWLPRDVDGTPLDHEEVQARIAAMLELQTELAVEQDVIRM